MSGIFSKKHVANVCADQFIRGSVFTLLTGGGVIPACVNGIVWCQSNILAGALVEHLKKSAKSMDIVDL